MSSNRASHLRNAAIIGMANYFEYGVGLIVGMLIARELGPHKFGIYSFAVWSVGWLLTCSCAALKVLNVKFVAEVLGNGREDLAAALSWNLLRIQNWATCSLICVYGLAIYLSNPEDWQGMLIPYFLLSGLALWARGRFWMYCSVFNGREKFSTEGITLGLVAVVSLISILTWKFFSGDLLTCFAIYSFTGLLSITVMRWFVRRDSSIVLTNSPLPENLRKRVWAQGRVTFLLVLLGLLGARSIEILVLKKVATSATVGYFALAGTLTKGAVDLLSGGLNTILMPAMARKRGELGIEGVALVLRESARYFSFIGMLIVGAAILFAPNIVILMYGAKFLPAVPVVASSLVVAGFISCGTPLATFIASQERHRDMLFIALTGIVVNSILALTLIPKFGLQGAIASLAGTSAVWLVLVFLFARKLVQSPLPLGIMFRQFVAFVIAVGMGYALEVFANTKWSFIFSTTLFVVVFVLGSVGFRTWRKVDFETSLVILERMKCKHPWIERIVSVLSARFAIS